MAKVLLDVILVEGTDKQEFVDSSMPKLKQTGGIC